MNERPTYAEGYDAGKAAGVAEERGRWLAILDKLAEQARGAGVLCQAVCKEAQEEGFGDGYARAVADIVEEISDIKKAVPA